MLSRPNTSLTSIAALVLLASPARAQYGYGGYYGNGTSYGTRIGIGVGVAVGVALIIFGIGWAMRRRRARAFKAAYPVQAYQGQQQTQQSYGQQPQQSYGGGSYGQQQSYGNQQQYNNTHSYEMGQAQQGNGGDNYQAPPGYSGYRQDSSSGANANEQPYYPPPQSPPPAASTTTAHYAPPPGPPPAQNGSYDPTNVSQK